MGDTVTASNSFVNIFDNASNIIVKGIGNFVGVAEQDGAQIGSAIGQIIGGNNPFVQVAASTVLGALGATLSQYVGKDLATVVASNGDSVARAFGENLEASFVSTGIGFVSSQLTGDILHAAGITGFGGQLAGYALNSEITQGLDYVVNKVFNLAIQAPNLLDVANIASFFGSVLGQQILAPTTEAGAILGSLGSTIGGAVGSILGPIGTFIGSFVGDILGTLFGDLFGHSKPRIPTATASVELDLPFARYVLGGTTVQNNGDLAFVKQIAAAAEQTLNGLIYEVVGADGMVVNLTTRYQVYGINNAQLYVNLSGTQTNVASGVEAVDKGVLYAIKYTQLIGGDIFAKRAINNSLAVNVTTLTSDLRVAADYLNYRQHWQTINTDIAANPNSAFAAGWIITAQRANELNLGAWAPSDFYGGLQGFLSSFNMAASGAHYEDLSVNLSGGALTIGVPTSGLAKGYEPATSTDVNSQAAQVYRMYDTMLGRAPSAAEVSAGVAALNQQYAPGGSSRLTPSATEAGGFAGAAYDGLPSYFNTEDMAALESLAADMLNNPGAQARLGAADNAAFVAQAYLAAFHRAASASEINDWAYYLTAGWSRAGVLALFSEWHDHRAWEPIDPNSQTAQVYRLFDVAYGRLPGAGEVDGFLRQFASNLGAGGANAQTLTSVEAAGFALPTSDGVPSNVNHEDMAALKSAAAQLLADPLVQARLGATDNTTFINQIYQAAFRRAPYASEVTAWLNNIAAGWTRAAIVAAFSEWPIHRALLSSVIPNGVGFSSNVGQGLLSILPQASADGRSVSISNFAVNEGFTIVPIIQGVNTVVGAGNLSTQPLNQFASGAGFTNGVTIYGFSIAIAGPDNGSVIILGGNGADYLQATDGYAWVQSGGPVNDTIVGGGGNDVLLGGAGNDTITAGAGTTYIDGEGGTNTVAGGPGVDTYEGGSGKDIVTGGSGANTFVVYDTHGVNNGTTFTGGTGSNTLSFADMTLGVVVNLTTDHSAYGVAFSNVQNLVASNYNDVLTLADSGGTLTGGAGADVLNGGAGYDTFVAGSGTAIFNGGGGVNTVSYANSTSAVNINLATGTAFGGYAKGDVFNSVQNLIGSNFNDVLEGDAGVNNIYTGTGNSTIIATTGNDHYWGASGGFTTVDYSQTGFTSVNANLQYSGVSFTLADGTSGGQSISGVSAVIGTSGNDLLYASNAGSTLDGNGGNDVLFGGSGSDTFVFNKGYAGTVTVVDNNAASNTIRIGGGLTFNDLWAGANSTQFFLGDRGAAGNQITVNSALESYTDTTGNVIKTLDMGGSGQVNISGINYVASGTVGADTIMGQSWTSNLIFGYDGIDKINTAGGSSSSIGSIIDGGAGNDTIITSRGDDQFLFDRGSGADTITDAGGRNTIVFGPTVTANDLIYQVIGNDIYVGIVDPLKPTATASTEKDRIRMIGAAVQYHDPNNQSVVTSYNTTFTVQAGGVTTDLTKINLPWVISYKTGGGNTVAPIVLDFTGDGLELSSVSTSDIVSRDGNGVITRIGWVGPTNGILAFDREGNGKINTISNISFLQDKPGATSDLGGLAGWDTNGDGVINQDDANFGKLLVWVDANQDGRAGSGEVHTLSELGIASISLSGQSTGFNGSDTSDSYATATTTFTRADGTSGTAYDVALAREFFGQSDAQTPAGIDWGSLTADGQFGQLLSATASTLSSLGHVAGANALASYTVLSRSMKTDFSAGGGTISAADKKLWSSILHRRTASKANPFGGQPDATVRNTSAAAQAAKDAAAAQPTALSQGSAGAASPASVLQTVPTPATPAVAGSGVLAAPTTAGDGPAELSVSAPAPAPLAASLADWSQAADGVVAVSDAGGALAQLASQSLAAPLPVSRANTADAATTQRLQWLRQSLAGAPAGTSAFAPVWSRLGQADGIASLAAVAAAAPKFVPAHAG